MGVADGGQRGAALRRHLGGASRRGDQIVLQAHGVAEFVRQGGGGGIGGQRRADQADRVPGQHAQAFGRAEIGDAAECRPDAPEAHQVGAMDIAQHLDLVRAAVERRVHCVQIVEGTAFDEGHFGDMDQAQPLHHAGVLVDQVDEGHLRVDVGLDLRSAAVGRARRRRVRDHQIDQAAVVERRRGLPRGGGARATARRSGLERQRQGVVARRRGERRRFRPFGGDVALRRRAAQGVAASIDLRADRDHAIVVDDHGGVGRILAMAPCERDAAAARAFGERGIEVDRDIVEEADAQGSCAGLRHPAIRHGLQRLAIDPHRACAQGARLAGDGLLAGAGVRQQPLAGRPGCGHSTGPRLHQRNQAHPRQAGPDPVRHRTPRQVDRVRNCAGPVGASEIRLL